MSHSPHPLAWPSVTQALGVVAKDFLYRWYAVNGWEHCERVKKEAGELGQALHTAIEQVMRNEQHSIEGRQAEMLHTFMQWKEQSDFRPVEIERKVESKEYEYHGTLDSIGTFGDSNGLFILDWKTSSKIDNLYGAQLAAYAHAYQEETGFEILTGGVVRLEKDATKPKQIEVKTFSNLPEYFDVFKACLRIHKFLHPNKRKKWDFEAQVKIDRLEYLVDRKNSTIVELLEHIAFLESGLKNREGILHQYRLKECE